MLFALRNYQESDAEIILGWISDEKSFRQWSADKYKSYPASPEDMNAFYREMKAQGGIPFVFTEDNKVVGHFIVRPITDEDTVTYRLGFIIVDSTVRGKGYGKAMLSFALEYAFSTLSAKRVTLGVFENNPNALRCYESVGFKQVGESYYSINGETWKCLEMECFNS